MTVPPPPPAAPVPGEPSPLLPPRRPEFVDGPPAPPPIPTQPVTAWTPPDYSPTAGADAARYKVLWRRYFAYAVDGGIVQVPAWIAHVALAGFLSSTGLLMVSAVITGVGSIVYFGRFWTRKGGVTPGMRLLGLAMWRAEGGDEPLPLSRALVRVLLLQVAIAVLTGSGAINTGGLRLAQLVVFALDGWMLLLYATALMSPRRQSLHDRVAGTVVVRAGPADAGQWVTAILVVLGIYAVNLWLSLGPLRGV